MLQHRQQFALSSWRWVWIAALAVLVSCGGGDSDHGAQSASGGSGDRARKLDVTPPPTFFPNIPIPTDANTRGMWSPVYDWPLVSVHTIVLPDGRVLTFGSTTAGQQTGITTYDIWESTGAPDAGHMTLPNGTGVDLFCSSGLVLPPQSQGSPATVFIAGGDNWTGTQTTNTGNEKSSLLDVASSTLTRTNDMLRARWYSTSTTLVNGETYVQGGTGGEDRPEVRSLSGNFRLLSGVDTSSLEPLYPRNFVAPDGRIFGYDSQGRMYYIDPTGNGSLTILDLFDGQYARDSGSAAMFRPGRILQLGGNSNGALVIDITAGTPVVTPTQSLSSQRQWVNATILADGQVLATSGSEVHNQLIGVNTTAEIWNPTNGQWLQGAAGVRPRLYHSNAILLPDASVLVTGGGVSSSTDGGPANNLNSEIYYPPYLFTAGGQRASRPIIASAPSWIDIGKVIPVTVANASSVSRVVLLKTGASTHSFNMEQRFLDLTFNANGSDLSVQVPTRAADATPGYYYLFVFDGAGVPSVAKIVRMGIAAVTNPAIAPTIINPGAQTTERGSTVNLALGASDPNGDTLGFGAAGLPPGLTLDAVTGVITGVPTTAGSYSVVVTASDGVNNASANFVWTVTDSNAVIINPLPPVTAIQAGADGSFTATTQGGVNVLYRWNFGDGTGDTPWSPTATVTHAFTQGGTFNVTLSVTDASLLIQSRTFRQTVYLPSTANKPSASSNIALQTPATGNPRLWVVNQDNDSVSVFDAVTRAKQAEIIVGAAPRSIAVTPNGLVWVTNRDAASISVIDPTTNSVVQTIALPRASQPYGLAMSPTAGLAFVATEATGQLIKLDTTSFATLGSVAVGTNPRHLSVSADGVRVYVSRFITPPLPGESTATVTPTPSNGGEVVVVTASSLSIQRTIVLQHSDIPDAENQGRGIPNYLGAPAISPDGTQAWVPSKKDNVKRGALRDGSGLNFQSTVRAISSRIALGTQQEDLSRRVDHDNSSVASAAAYDSRGVYLFVALETSREVAVVDAHSGAELLRVDVGRAPQGLVVSADDATLFVNNFMDRTVGVYDLRPLLTSGQLNVPALAVLSTVTTEKLAPAVLSGKQFFYDARDTRLARDRYMSCASCHNDGASDGRTWDFTGQGEGLRNTVALRGRAGAQGRLHWSANFDEVQDFEAQIRSLAGGTGLMADVVFNGGTRNQPLGDPKAGLSADLDALAAYVGSLASFDASPHRDAAGGLTATGIAGRAVFLTQNCGSCHGSTAFTFSATLGLQDVGTLKPSSGQRLGGPLLGIDIPTLRDVWRTGPYLHDGSAATLDEAVLLHSSVTISNDDLTSLVQYLREIGTEEAAPPGTLPSGLVAGISFNEGTGTSAADLTGNGHTAALVNGPTWGAGQFGGAVSLDGSNDSITLATPSTLNFGSSSFTVMMWIKRSSTGGSYQQHLLSKCLPTAWEFGCKEFYLAGGALRLGSYNTGDTNSVAINDTNWHHVALVFTRASNTVQIYIDGTLRTTATQDLEADGASHVVTLGNQGNANPFGGLLDEVRIYNQALSAAQVATAMTTPLAPVADTTPPVLSNPQPSGTLPAGTTQATLSLASDENATCRYATAPGTAYGTMISSFASTGGTVHSTTVSGLANGQSYSYYVRCQDSAGNANGSDLAIGFAVAVPDTTAPTVGMSAPANGATVSGTLSVSATASDNVGVVGVQFLLDGVALGAEDTSAPYSVSWNSTTASNASHTLSARARDAAGNQTTSTLISVTVSNTVPDTTAPTVGMSAPANGATVSGTLSVSATASDNVGVVGVQFLLDGVALGAEDTSAPYSVSWNSTTASNASHTLSARARDAAGNQTTSTLISVTVSNTVPDTTAPTVGMSAPANGATVSGTLSVSATASDNVGVVGVQFLLDGVALGAEDTSAPYSVSWNSTTASNASHTLSARARDAAGNQTTSTLISVTVSNGPPPSGLVAGISFNEGTGTSAADLTGNGHTAALVNGPTWGAGQFGGAVSLDGSNDSITLATPSTLNFGSSSFTVMMWIKRSSTGGSYQQHLLSKCLPTAWEFGCKEFYLAGGALRLGSYNTGDTNSVAINDTNWHHVALVFTRASNTVQIYIDGTLRTTATQDLEADGASHVVTLGNQGNANPFGGLLDEVRIYNQALSAAQVATAMTTPLAPVADTTPPVLSNPQPSGTLPAGTTQATLSLASDENATCRYATAPGTAYGTMISSFASTGGTVHSTTVSGLANGQSYSYYVRCQDSAGNANGSDLAIGFAVAVPDTTAPTVGMSAPANGATVSGTLSVSATASDNVGVVGVQFLLDGVALGAEDTSAPYSVSWNSTTASNASHTLSARARDAAGNQTTSTLISVTVSNTVPDTTAPTVGMSAPANGATVSGTLSVSATASDNVGVVGVQFLLDGVALGAEDTSAPYSVSWNSTTASNASHTLSARARDAAGNQTTSTLISVTVSNTVPDTTAPTVGMSAPANGATVSGTLSVSATASDNVGVVGVQFLLDGVALGAEDTSAPYSVSWNSTTASNASHTLSARARDAAGNQTTSTLISVTVSNGPPPSGLVAGISFNEGTGTSAADLTGNGHTAALVNGPTWGAGQFGGAVSLDGSNDSITLATPSTLNFGSSSFTVMMWIKRSSTGGSYQQHLLSKCLPTAWEFGCKEFYLAGGALRLGSYNTGDTNSVAINDTNWHHVALVFTRASNTVQIYIDGTLRTTATQDLEADGASHVVTLGNQGNANPFGGLLDEVRIYNQALSAAQVTAAMSAPL